MQQLPMMNFTMLELSPPPPLLTQGTSPPGGEGVMEVQAGLYGAVFQAYSDKVRHTQAQTDISPSVYIPV